MRMGRSRSVSPVLVEALEDRCLLSASAVHATTAAALKMVGHARAKATVTSIVGKLATASKVTVSTVPSNGDVNPYGVSFVPDGFPKGGPLQAGDVLVSNFNGSSNMQGTGTTIDRVTPAGKVSTFFQSATPTGLTTGLQALRDGFVVVGNLPSTDGTSATAGAGSLIVLDRFGFEVANLSNAVTINGPWDLTVNDQGNQAQVFVANVLNGTITRIDLAFTGTETVSVTGVAQIASGYVHRGDPTTFEVGPTGLAYNAKTDTLFVAATGNNGVFAVPHAGSSGADHGKGRLIFSSTTALHGPLGLVLAPDGNLIVANGDAINPDPAQPSELVEFTQAGAFVGQFSIDTNADAPFGLAVTTASNGHVRLAAVDDNVNMLTIWTE